MSDEYVLKSQKYLNSMYGGHPSWVTLQENGNTGTLVKSLGKTLKKPYFMGFFYYAFGFSQFERGIRAKTTKPPAMRVVSKNVIQNNHHSFYNEGVQAIKIRKNGDYNG